MAETRLAMATRHVERGRQIVSGQRLLVERLQLNGRPTADAERLLALYEHSLDIFEHDLADLVAKDAR